MTKTERVANILRQKRYQPTAEGCSAEDLLSGDILCLLIENGILDKAGLVEYLQALRPPKADCRFLFLCFLAQLNEEELNELYEVHP